MLPAVIIFIKYCLFMLVAVCMLLFSPCQISARLGAIAAGLEADEQLELVKFRLCLLIVEPLAESWTLFF